MDKDFIDILQKLVSEQGNGALTDTKKCKAFLADYAGSEYKKERRFVVQAVEVGAAKAITEAQDLAACKQAQVRELEEECGFSTAVAADVVDTLALVLRGDASKTQTAPPTESPPKPQTAPPAVAPPPPQAPPKDLKYRVIASGTKIEITGFTGETEVIIPPYIENLPVTHIGKKAFKDKQLTSVTIPNTVTHIMEEAFRLNLLTSVTIPNSVTYIGSMAFYQNRLKSVTIPDSVTDIRESAFISNDLKSVTIPHSIPNNLVEWIFGKGVTVTGRRKKSKKSPYK